MTETIVSLLLCSCKEVTKSRRIPSGKTRRNRNALQRSDDIREVVVSLVLIHGLFCWTVNGLLFSYPHRRRFRWAYARKLVMPCDNLVPSVEAGNDFVGQMGEEVGHSKSSAEGLARDVKNFRGTSFLPLYGIPYSGTFGSFSLGQAKENEHQSLCGQLLDFYRAGVS